MQIRSLILVLSLSVAHNPHPRAQTNLARKPGSPKTWLRKKFAWNAIYDGPARSRGYTVYTAATAVA
jgi:hypothetical protein